MGQKRAVLVGINYAGRGDEELKGCLNDVARMRRCLVDRFGFDEAGIRVLADADPSTPPPTGANIRRELERLVAGAHLGKGWGAQCPRGGAPTSVWVLHRAALRALGRARGAAAARSRARASAWSRARATSGGMGPGNDDTEQQRPQPRWG